MVRITKSEIGTEILNYDELDYYRLYILGSSGESIGAETGCFCFRPHRLALVLGNMIVPDSSGMWIFKDEDDAARCDETFLLAPKGSEFVVTSEPRQ
jgi:hypothetical protein